VLWAVASVVVGSVDFQIIRIAVRHCPLIERLEGLPFSTDANSAAVVPCSSHGIAGLVAPLFHAVPDSIQSRARHSVRDSSTRPRAINLLGVVGSEVSSATL